MANLNFFYERSDWLRLWVTVFVLSFTCEGLFRRHQIYQQEAPLVRAIHIGIFIGFCLFNPPDVSGGIELSFPFTNKHARYSSTFLLQRHSQEMGFSDSSTGPAQ